MKTNLFNDVLHRLRSAWKWVAGQFAGNLLLLLIGLAWTRLPDKHLWQVALTLLIPLLLGVSLLELHAATVRCFAADDGKRVRLVWGALTLLVWLAVAAGLWDRLDWFEDQVNLCAGYLNSLAPAHARVTYLSFPHLQWALNSIGWLLRWVLVPGVLVPLGAASAQWGWRLPWRRAWRVILNWRWFVGVLVAALLGAALPARLFAAVPAGAVSAQVWNVALKLALAYLLAVGGWVLLLAWVAVLFDRQNPPAEDVLVPVPVFAGPPEMPSPAMAAPIPMEDESDEADSPSWRTGE